MSVFFLECPKMSFYTSFGLRALEEYLKNIHLLKSYKQVHKRLNIPKNIFLSLNYYLISSYDIIKLRASKEELFHREHESNIPSFIIMDL